MTGKRLLKTTVCLISILAISALLTALTFPYPSRNDPYKWFNTMEVVGEGERNEYLTWALGEDWASLKSQYVPPRWNSRHGDLFLLYGTGCPKEGNKRMYEAWKNRAGEKPGDIIFTDECIDIKLGHNDANDVYVYWDANDFTHAYDIIFFLEGGGEVLFGFQGDKLKITGMENCDEVAAEFFKHFIKPMADAYVEDKLEDPNDGTITHAAIETDHSLAIDFDTSDTPDYVQISIR